MPDIEFNEKELNNLNKLAEKLFINTNEKDPTSIYYKRHLERPKINLFKIVIHIALIFTILMITYFIMLTLNLGFVTIFSIEIIIFIIYILAHLKRLLICIVKIYQRLAPDSLRNKCRFEPSCSQYMILSLEKYGALKGFFWGVKRIKRCKVGNGGYDFP